MAAASAAGASTENPCAICLEELSDPTNGPVCELLCTHLYHFTECIKPLYENSQKNWKCPQCRVPFDKVRVYGQGWVTCKVHPKWATRSSEDSERSDDEDEDDEDDRCFVCQAGHGELLICDGCDKLCHVGCAGLTSVPLGEWFCSACRPQPNIRRTNRNETAKKEAVAKAEAIDEAWKHFDILNSLEDATLRSNSFTRSSTVQSARSSTVGTSASINSSNVSPQTVIRWMESANKSHTRRQARLDEIVRILEKNRVNDSYINELLNSGFLNLLRGWLELSLNSPTKRSKAEKHFRHVLLQQLSAIISSARVRHIKVSRINRVLLRCMGEDLDQIQTLASELFQRCCFIVGAFSTSQSDLPQEQQVQQQQAQSAFKRPKVVRFPPKSS